MIEILMCTYNGDKFIEKQLLSIYNQTKQPDLVRIFDDKSTDNTVEILNNFIREKNLNNWIVTVNESQKGWRRNFYDAIKSSTGDIIFLCDQDDIWKKDKIEVMSKALVDNNLLRLSGLQYTIDEDDNFIIKKDIITCPNNYDKHITIEKFNSNIEHLVWKNRIGCAIAINKEMVKMLDFFDFEACFAHDVWCVQLSSLFDRGGVIEYPCLKYRVHSNNATAGFMLDIKSNYEIKKHITTLCKQSFEYFFKNLTKLRDKLNNKQFCKAKNQLEMIILRYEMFQKKSIIIWFKLFKYLRYYPKKKTYFADLLDLLSLR